MLSSYKKYEILKYFFEPMLKVINSTVQVKLANADKINSIVLVFE